MEQEHESGETEVEDDDWWKAGDDVDQAIEDEDERREKVRAGQVWRWYLKDGQEKTGTFVDGDESPHGLETPFVFMEHQVEINGDFKNWFTCIQGRKGPDGKKMDCPLCKGGNQAYLAGAFTIIDHTIWKDKGGKKHKDDKKLFVCKSQVLKVLRKAMAKKEGLRGWRVEISRTGEKTPNTGDQFDFESRTELDDEMQPFDYRKEFKPKTYDELMEIVGDVSRGDGSEDEVKF